MHFRHPKSEEKSYTDRLDYAAGFFCTFCELFMHLKKVGFRRLGVYCMQVKGCFQGLDSLTYYKGLDIHRFLWGT